MVALGKGYVTVAHGQVHYRHGGRGPLLVMLHDAARSSQQHAASMEWLGEYFTVVAPDLPGHGNSAPLPVGQRELPDYSAALAATLAALGIARCRLYGRGAGAAVGLHLAAHHPAKVALAVCDGLEQHQDASALDAPGHAPEWLDPRDDGGHLAADWTGLLLDVAGDTRYANTARAAQRLANARIAARPAATAERARIALEFLA